MAPRTLSLLAWCALGLVRTSSAQSDVTWDSSGNGLLNGTYNFRQVVWQVGDAFGGLKRSVALTGQLTFDGLGNYTLSAQVMDSQTSALQSYTKNGTYAIAASGYGFLSSTNFDTGKVFGLVSQGIFVGSSTEPRVSATDSTDVQAPSNDMLIAAPAASPAPSNESLKGSYWVTEVNFPSLDTTLGRDALWQMNPDGNGNLGTLSVAGYIGSRTRKVTQTVNNATYTFGNGIGRTTFGGTLSSTNLVAGDRVLFLSPDGNFVFGGTLDGWNMFVGVRALADKATQDMAKGLFYQGGVNAYVDTDGSAEFDTYYGAVAMGSANQINHWRLYAGFDPVPYDYVYADPVALGSDGTWEDFLGFQNIFGSAGSIIIGFGGPQNPGISVALKAPAFSGDGVYLNPAGVINTAGFAPFTTGISRGAMVTLNGTALASAPLEDSTFPTKLGTVQVLINGRPAPLKSVSPEQITTIVPYATKEGIARIQVINNGVESNAVTMYVNPQTSPGVFTVPAGGYGYAQALHANGADVTPDRPARLGETISLLLSGLGDVEPAVLEGTPGPENPRSKVVVATDVVMGGESAVVLFAGLAPGLIGVYRIDFILAAGQRVGDRYVNIGTPDAYISTVKIPVVAAGSAEPTEKEAAAREGRQQRKRPRGWQSHGGAVQR